MALCVCAMDAKAQRVSREFDSLLSMSNTAADSLLPGIYYKMAFVNRLNNPVRGIQYAIKTIEAAESLDNHYYLIMGHTMLAMCEKNANMPEAALEHYLVAKEYAEQFNEYLLMGHCYNNVARQYMETGDLKNGQVFVNKAMDIAKTLDDSTMLAYSYLNYGILFEKEGKYDLAIGYLTESYSMKNKLGGGQSVENYVPLWHLTDIYMTRGDYDKAKELMYINLKNPTLSDLHGFLSRTWYMLAQIYYRSQMLDSAESACHQSKHEATACYNVIALENSCKLLDSIYLAMGKPRMAADICKGYMQVCDELYDNELSDQLLKIQYSSEYRENEKRVDKSNSILSISIIWLLIALAALLGGGYLFYMLVSRSKKINRLNGELLLKRKTLENDLDYAHTIQMAVQSDINCQESVFSDRFLIYLPRDIVSGDFFWRYADARYEMIAVADCTGHGVPGAMLTMLGTSMLQDMATAGMRNSADILNELRSRVKFMMGVNDLNRMQDGMDIALIIVDKNNMSLDYAGAYNSLFYIHDGQLQEIKATRCPIGEYIKEKKFVSNILELRKGDFLFMMSDGFTSQFGGPDNVKMPQRMLRDLILEHSDMALEELMLFLQNYFYEWMGDREQVDDVTVAGFRV